MTDSGALPLPGGRCKPQRRRYGRKGKNSQDPRAGGADEGAHCHVDIGRAALVAVEAFPIRGQASHFPEHLQMSLLLLSLRARRHGGKQRAGTTGEEVRLKDPGQGGRLRGRLVACDGGGRADTLPRGLARRLGD